VRANLPPWHSRQTPNSCHPSLLAGLLCDLVGNHPVMSLKRLAPAWAAFLGLPAAFGFAALPADYQGKPFTDEYHQTGPVNIPGIVQCALYDLGGEGVAYHDTTPLNEGSNGLNRQTTPDNHQRTHGCDYIWHFRANEAVDLSYVKDWADLNHPNAVSPA